MFSGVTSHKVDETSHALELIPNIAATKSHSYPLESTRAQDHVLSSEHVLLNNFWIHLGGECVLRFFLSFFTACSVAASGSDIATKK